MATIDERIATLEAKLKQEKARKQRIEARKRAAESKLQRSQDTRRKILVGARPSSPRSSARNGPNPSSWPCSTPP